MEPDEVMELSEAASDRQKRVIGLTTAVVAAALAIVTLMGHRLHTEEIVLQTKAADGWAYYQAKNTRSQMYATDAGLAAALGAAGPATADWEQKAVEERRQAVEARRENEERDAEITRIAQRASLFDASEVFLEVAIVLCSIALLTSRAGYWRASFVSSGLGIVAAAVGLFR
jgi:Domain of unknown function (DUF4337)